jgi:CHAT domain-containing protein
MANLRFRFKLSLGNKQDPDPLSFSEHLQEVVLEAMLDDQKEFLMLQAPIFRRLSIPHGICAIDGEDDLYELFSKQDRALRCLIIEAYTSGNARLNDEIITGLKPLKYLHQESQTLEKFLLQSHHEVTRLSKDHLPENLSFKDWVKQVLKEDGPWDLVHFAGHSTYATDKTGYVIFPGKNYAESMNIEDFSGLLNLARVKFVYLSSCQSSKDDFVFQMANRQVPAILGFRWRIDDEPAKDYAVVFYERLIKRRSLEQAFLEARTFMHNHKRYKKNRIWASPLLILQRP